MMLPYPENNRFRCGRCTRRAAREGAQHEVVVLWEIIQPQQRAPPPLELDSRHGQHRVWVEDHDLVIIGLFARGARVVLVVELDANVVAVVPPGAAAAQRLLVAGLAFEGQRIPGMLRDGEGAAAGNVRHEKGGAIITRPSELLAAADVVVAVPAMQASHSLSQQNEASAAPRITCEVEATAIKAGVDLQLRRQVHEAVLRNRQVAAMSK
jgi:hypothetical protein